MSALRLFEFDSDVVQSTPTSIWDAEVVCHTFDRHPVYDIIFSEMDPRTLFAMACVSRLIRGAVKDYVKRAFNVNRLLSRFFSDPIAFRSLQARTATLISGSVALQFFDRSVYPESDLDLYPHGQHVLELGQFLEREGYKFMPNSRQNVSLEKASKKIWSVNHTTEPANDLDEEQLRHYMMSTVDEVFTFQRPSVDSRNPVHPAKVQIIKARRTPLSCILGFHSTCVMNIIAYDAAYSLYPSMTFQRREALVIGANERQGPALRKYSARGWTLINQSSPLLFLKEQGSKMYSKRFFLDEPRWVNDARSWVIPLNVDGVSGPTPLSPSSEALTWDPVRENGWTLKGDAEFKSVWVSYHQTRTGVVYYTYYISEDEYLEVLKEFFKAQGPIEYSKSESLGSSVPHETYWTWWDASLPLLRQNYMLSLEEKAAAAQGTVDVQDQPMSP